MKSIVFLSLIFVLGCSKKEEFPNQVGHWTVEHRDELMENSEVLWWASDTTYYELDLNADESGQFIYDTATVALEWLLFDQDGRILLQWEKDYETNFDPFFRAKYEIVENGKEKQTWPFVSDRPDFEPDLDRWSRKTLVLNRKK